MDGKSNRCGKYAMAAQCEDEKSDANTMEGTTLRIIHIKFVIVFFENKIFIGNGTRHSIRIHFRCQYLIGITYPSARQDFTTSVCECHNTTSVMKSTYLSIYLGPKSMERVGAVRKVCNLVAMTWERSFWLRTLKYAQEIKVFVSIMKFSAGWGEKGSQILMQDLSECQSPEFNLKWVQRVGTDFWQRIKVFGWGGWGWGNHHQQSPDH